MRAVPPSADDLAGGAARSRYALSRMSPKKRDGGKRLSGNPQRREQQLASRPRDVLDAGQAGERRQAREAGHLRRVDRCSVIEVLCFYRGSVSLGVPKALNRASPPSG